jgi:hypothetical protein
MFPKLAQLANEMKQAAHPESRLDMTYMKRFGSTVFRYFAPIRYESNCIGNQIGAVVVYDDNPPPENRHLAKKVYVWSLSCTLEEAEDALRVAGVPENLMPSKFLVK